MDIIDQGKGIVMMLSHDEFNSLMHAYSSGTRFDGDAYTEMDLVFGVDQDLDGPELHSLLPVLGNERAGANIQDRTPLGLLRGFARSLTMLIDLPETSHFCLGLPYDAERMYDELLRIDLASLDLEDFKRRGLDLGHDRTRRLFQGLQDYAASQYQLATALNVVRFAAEQSARVLKGIPTETVNA